MLNYTKEDLTNAELDVLDGISLRKASLAYRVPRQTLANRIPGT